MIRSRLARIPTSLSKIAQNIARLKAERTGGLVDVTPSDELNPATATKHPHHAKAVAAPPTTNYARTKYDSIEAMQASLEEEDEAVHRVFEERPAYEQQKLLRPGWTRDLDAEPYQEFDENTELLLTKIDEVTGVADVVRAAMEDEFPMSQEEVILLRKVSNAMMFASHSTKPEAIDYMFSILRKLVNRAEIVRHFTPYAWEFLWAFDESEIPTFRSRLIGDLMAKAGAPFNRQQELKYIGGLFWNDAKDAAIKRWEGLVERDPAPEVYTIGVKMFTLQCRPDVVEWLIEDMVKKVGYADHRHYGSVAQAYNHMFEGEKAWEAFKKLEYWEKKNNAKTSAQQLDDLAMSFLDGHQPAYGLEVFKKLVRDTPPSERVAARTFANLERAVYELQESATKPEELNEISRSALEHLPPTVNNKHFYGAWLLNLLRMGRPDLACYVSLEVQPAAGFPAEATQVNWVIQGFLEMDNLKMAEFLVNRMAYVCLKEIGNHEAAAALAEESSIGSLPPEAGQLAKLVDPARFAEKIPAATVQTFSVIMQYLSRRQNLNSVIKFTQTMINCDIEWNSYILNHLLYALLRSSEMTRLSLTFTSMVPPEGRIVPDSVTYGIMWAAVRNRYTQNRRKTDFITPRELFQYMFTTNPEIDPTDDKAKKMWYHLIQSFFLSHDLEGALLALHAASKQWKFAVDPFAVRLIALGVFKNRPGAHIEAVGKEKLDESTRALLQLGAQLDSDGRRKKKRQGRAVLDVESKVKVGKLDAVTQLLWYELKGAVTQPASPVLLDEIARAKEDMGLAGVDLGLRLENCFF
ncbi:hypothetical protein EX30DRAFT_395321 [Ascodesmis nigricans]|uniref:Pentatricopeptide repeat protein n=1 Tax=Ascodesmis nigricans TaxID=341454 RepID=A0A4V3SIY4_9PEZI|nr:hypothetical protein EX30DRAFT_395321 [Ascodesmis nigricans]